MWAWLLDNGANVNHICRFTGSVLMHAIHSGKTEVVKLLLDRGVNVNQWLRGCSETKHDTALALAISEDKVEIATMLRNKGAKLERIYAKK